MPHHGSIAAVQIESEAELLAWIQQHNQDGAQVLNKPVIVKELGAQPLGERWGAASHQHASTIFIPCTTTRKPAPATHPRPCNTDPSQMSTLMAYQLHDDDHPSSDPHVWCV